MQAAKPRAPVPAPVSYRRPFSALKAPPPPPSSSSSSSAAEDDEESTCLSSLTTWFYNLLPGLRPTRRTENAAPRSESAQETEYSIPAHQTILPPPTLFPEWTPAELETLITRWLCTHPGPLNHPQNIELASLLNLVDGSSASAAEAALLHASLLHRLKMDHLIELLARDIGLHFLPVPAAGEGSTGILGIEEFPPPPANPLSPEARRLLLGCRGEWKEAVMPLPATGVRCRYRKPKYWVVSVAAGNGWSSERLDEKMREWFLETKGDEERKGFDWGGGYGGSLGPTGGLC